MQHCFFYCYKLSNQLIILSVSSRKGRRAGWGGGAMCRFELDHIDKVGKVNTHVQLYYAVNFICTYIPLCIALIYFCSCWRILHMQFCFVFASGVKSVQLVEGVGDIWFWFSPCLGNLAEMSPGGEWWVRLGQRARNRRGGGPYWRCEMCWLLLLVRFIRTS